MSGSFAVLGAKERGALHAAAAAVADDDDDDDDGGGGGGGDGGDGGPIQMPSLESWRHTTYTATATEVEEADRTARMGPWRRPGA